MVLDSCGIKHSAGSGGGIRIVVLIGVVNYFAYAGLNQGRGTYITRE